MKKLLYDFSNIDVAFIEIRDKLVSDFNKVIEDLFDEKDTRVVVMIDYISNGIIDHREVLIYKNYTRASAVLNQYEYKNDIAVEVYELNSKVHTHMLYKVFDGYGYQRLAGAAPYANEALTIVRNMYDTNAVVYDCSC